MKPATRVRATTLLAFALSVPTALTLFAGDIGVTTATVRVMLAIAVAMAAVGALATILDRAQASAAAAPMAETEAGGEAVAADDALPAPEAIPPPPISAFVEPPPQEDRIPPAEPPVFGDLDDERIVEDQPPL